MARAPADSSGITRDQEQQLSESKAMGLISTIRNAASAIGRTADKFTPWAGDIERAAAFSAEIEHIRGEGYRGNPPDPHQVDEQYWPGPDAARGASPAHGRTRGLAIEGLDYQTGVPGRTEAEILADYNEGRIDAAEYERQVDDRYSAMDAAFAEWGAEEAVEAGFGPAGPEAGAGLTAGEREAPPVPGGFRPARTMADIVTVYNEGRIGLSEYDRQRQQRITEVSADEFNEEERGAPMRELTDKEIDQIEAAEEQRQADYWGGTGPDWEADAAEAEASMPASAEERALIRQEFEDGIPAPDWYSAEDMASWRAEHAEPALTDAPLAAESEYVGMLAREREAYRGLDGYEDAQTVKAAAAFAGIDLEELEPGTDPENGDQAALNAAEADSLRAARADIEVEQQPGGVETGQPSESDWLEPEMTEEKIAERVAEWEVAQEEHWWESDWGPAAAAAAGPDLPVTAEESPDWYGTADMAAWRAGHAARAAEADREDRERATEGTRDLALQADAEIQRHGFQAAPAAGAAEPGPGAAPGVAPAVSDSGAEIQIASPSATAAAAFPHSPRHRGAARPSAPRPAAAAGSAAAPSAQVER
jgi:hypothetical protein